MISLLLAAALAVPPVQKDGLELRFVEAGAFRFSDGQGAEMDLVNARDQPVPCAVRLLLSREDPATGEWKEVRKIDTPTALLPPRARAGFRVMEPPAVGRCRVDYEVLAGGQPFAKGRFDFGATGPYEVFLRPFFLLRDGVAVRVVGPTGALRAERYRFKLVEPRSGKPLVQSDEFRTAPDTEAIGGASPRSVAEGFLSFKGLPPAAYRIVVEVRSPSGKNLATLAALIDEERPPFSLSRTRAGGHLDIDIRPHP